MREKEVILNSFIEGESPRYLVVALKLLTEVMIDIRDVEQGILDVVMRDQELKIGS